MRVCNGECVEFSPEDEPLTLQDITVVGYHSYMKPLGGSSVCGQTYNLKGIKGKISFFLKLCFSFTVAHFMT